MRRVLVGVMAAMALPTLAAAQGRTMLDAGMVGGNSVACPGHYMGIEHRVVGPLAGYGMAETYRCAEVPEPSFRVGAALRLAREGWTVRPALRGGVEYDTDGVVSPTVGGSLTFGRKYGARFIVDRWNVGGVSLVLMQIGGYVSF